jgi:hypothetical protein
MYICKHILRLDGVKNSLLVVPIQMQLYMQSKAFLSLLAVHTLNDISM